MGSEQSSSRLKVKNPKRSQSAGTEGGKNASPRPSICSDSDIPYISYAATRPISEDPPERGFRWGELKKRREASCSREKRDGKAKSAGSIVVVKPALKIPTVDKDPLLRRLKEVPQFAPIIRGSQNVYSPWDPQLTEKIDPTPMIRIAHFYENRLIRTAEEMKQRQECLAEEMSQVEILIQSITTELANKENSLILSTHKLGWASEMTKSVSKCHCVLNETLESIEVLNNLLPLADRLETFVWTTG